MKRTILLLAGLTFITGKSQSQTVADYDGNVYDTVTIGTQVWFKQNLKVTHYNNGMPVPNVADSATWSNLTTGARCYYGNDSATHDSVYGSLYNWYAATSINQICPTGWKVPTDQEWTALENFLGGSMVAGGPLKETGTFHWLSPNVGATNSTGFTGLPGGMRGLTDTFQTLHENGLWWTFSSVNSSYAYSRYLWYMNAGVDRNPTPKKLGLSIRCMRNISTGLEEMNSIEKFEIFPNPSNSNITIVCSGNRELNLFVYNVTGEIVLLTLLSKITNVIDISSLPNGIYVVKISGDQGSGQKKLIKY